MWFKLILVGISLIFGAVEGDPTVLFDQQDARLTVPQILTKYNYTNKVYQVITDDQYNLTLHRIPGAGSPILLVHGLLCSSADWIIQGPKTSLAYLLADAGYDVWMFNARGNRYSRQHVTLKPWQKAFWNFSWHEIAMHDLPATIDTILNVTGHETLQYIGHSQGTTIFFVLCSIRPDFCQAKIRAMQAFAPVAHLDHVKAPLLKMIARSSKYLNILQNWFGLYEFLPHSKFNTLIARLFCGYSVNHNLCLAIIFPLCGDDPSELDPALVPVLLGHVPAGSATNQILHYTQVLNNKRFAQFDFGEKRNLEQYGMKKPPVYNVSAINVPIVIHWGPNDLMATPTDVGQLAEELPHVVSVRRVPHDKFNHNDFSMAKNVRTLLFESVMEFVKRLDQQ